MRFSGHSSETAPQNQGVIGEDKKNLPLYDQGDPPPCLRALAERADQAERNMQRSLWDWGEK